MSKRETKYRFEQMAGDESKTVKPYIYDDVTAYGDSNLNNWITKNYTDIQTVEGGEGDA